MMVQLHRVDGATVAAAVGLKIDLPVVSMVAVDEGVAIAAWGLAWKERRCFLWFYIDQPHPEHLWTIVKEARKMLRRAAQLGETDVFVTRDETFSSSLRLLKIMGFEPSSIEDGKEVWRWQVF